MKLERLSVQSLPGIEPGFVLEHLDPAVNLITGPNGIGKTSLVRALRHLVGGVDETDPIALSLSAVFVNGGRWTVQRAGRQIAWSHDGRPAEPPSLPGRDQLHCYWLLMEDLLQADERDEHLAAELRRALAGGYDLPALREAPAIRVGPRIGYNEARRVQAAQRDLHKVENDYEALRREEATLPEIETAIEKARRAAVRAEHLDRALTLLDTVQQRRQKEAALATFPAHMDRLRGDERERLQKLEDKRRECTAEREAAHRRQAENEVALNETGLATERPTPSALEAERARLEHAKRNSELLADRQAQLERAQAEADQAQAALGGQNAAPQLTPETVAEAESLARRLQAKQAEIDDLESRQAEASQVPSASTIAAHLRASEALRAWLAAADRGPTRVAWALAVLGAVIATGAGFWAANGPALIGGLIALAGLAWLGWGWREAGPTEPRRRFMQTGLEAPVEWQRVAVTDRLAAIDARYTDLLQRQWRAQEAEDRQRRLERSRQEREALEAEKLALAERLGFDPALTSAGLDHFVRRTNEYQKAAAERASHQAAVSRLQQETEALGDRVKSFLEHWRIAADESLEGLSAALAELTERHRRAEVAEQRMRDAGSEVERLDKQLGALEADREALYREAGLEVSGRLELEARCERLSEWQTLRQALRDFERREAEYRQALEGESALLDQVDREEREALERERDKAREEAGTLEERRDRQNTIQTRLNDAGRDQKLEEALAEHDDALQALRDRREEALFAEAGQFLLDAVEAEHRSEHEPEVLRDARDRFRRFTHHGWDLVLDEEHGFMARDGTLETTRPLSELSAGTRMQLMLAVRLAWTRRIEQGRTALPLFLDEALTTTDETRFQSVAESLIRLARDEGRQVFYLSARRQEVALWEHLTGERPHHIDLAAVRFGGEGLPPEALRLPEREPLPPPGDRPPEYYAAELGVRPVDPRRGPGALHLFYLLRDDLPRLHRLMEDWRITHLSELETLLSSNAADVAIADHASRSRLKARCGIARSWIAVWQQGRGKPVDRIALEQSGEVSDRFIDRVAELAEELGGDGRGLIDAMRDGAVARFRSSNTDALEEWLEEQGYIVTDAPLSAEDRERRTLMEAATVANAEEVRQVVEWLEVGLRAGQ